MENKNTIEYIENVFWGDAPAESSALVKKCHNLRKKDLGLFDTEDLRILIGQNMSLEIIMPLAIKVIKENIFAEGDYYPGDLLKNILISNRKYWDNNSEIKQQVIELFERNIDDLRRLDIPDEIQNEILEAFFLFKG